MNKNEIDEFQTVAEFIENSLRISDNQGAS